MTTKWVAASVRSRAMVQRRVGSAGARELATRPTLEAAIDALAISPYGHDVRSGQTLAQAQHAVVATTLWHTRVLAGWLPRGDARLLRVLAGGFEVANVDERLREIDGGAPEPAFRLGGLATSWTMLSGAASAADMRHLLSRSAWGDPGSDTADGVRLGMRLSWAARVSASVPRARSWAAGAAALMVAREHLLDRSRIAESAALIATPLLGTRWRATSTLQGFAAQVPTDAQWPFEQVDDPGDLWRAETAWWMRVAADGFTLLRQPLTSADPVIGAVAVLGADAWLVRGALEVAARGGASTPHAMEAFDAVA